MKKLLLIYALILFSFSLKAQHNDESILRDNLWSPVLSLQASDVTKPYEKLKNSKLKYKLDSIIEKKERMV